MDRRDLFKTVAAAACSLVAGRVPASSGGPVLQGMDWNWDGYGSPLVVTFEFSDGSEVVRTTTIDDSDGAWWHTLIGQPKSLVIRRLLLSGRI